MNPYTYKRRRETAAKVPTSPAPLFGRAAEFVMDMLTAPIHSLVALAFVAFAASSAFGLTLNANAELSALNFDIEPGTNNLSAATDHGRVLGEQTTANVEELASAIYSISAMPMEYDHESGLWSYGVEVNFPENLLANGVLMLGKKELAKDFKGSASFATGAVFKPGSRAEINLVNKTAKGLQRVAMIVVLVPPALDAEYSDADESLKITDTKDVKSLQIGGKKIK